MQIVLCEYAKQNYRQAHWRLTACIEILSLFLKKKKLKIKDIYTISTLFDFNFEQFWQLRGSSSQTANQQTQPR